MLGDPLGGVARSVVDYVTYSDPLRCYLGSTLGIRHELEWIGRYTQCINTCRSLHSSHSSANQLRCFLRFMVVHKFFYWS